MTAALYPLPLQEGANNQNVNMVQYFLQTLKLYSEPIDGIFGPKTKEAVLKFQAAYGLIEDGIVMEETAIALDIEARAAQQPVIKEGSTGEVVKEFQEIYNQQHGTLTVDGVFGAKTKEAAIKFQQSQGLTADGIVGAKTWSSLYTLGMHPGTPVAARINLIFNVSDC
ncbi:MAG: peptidoglycan-binding protein [Cyanobacteria bacterium J06635_10]